MQVPNVNIAQENCGLAEKTMRVVIFVHHMNPHIKKTRNGKVVKRTTWKTLAYVKQS